MKVYYIMDKEEKGIYISFTDEYEAKEYIEKVKKENPKRIEVQGLHIVEKERLTVQEKVERAIEKINLKIKQYEKRIKLREEKPCYFDEEKDITRFYERIEGLELAKKYLEEELG